MCDNVERDENVNDFKSGKMPEPNREIILFYSDNDTSRYTSTHAWTNENGEIRTAFPLLEEIVAWGYKESFYIPSNVEDFVKIYITDFYDDSDNGDVDLDLGVFRSVPTYEQFRKFIKAELPGATILNFSEMTPKLTYIDIVGEVSSIVSVYADFIISYKNVEYRGVIEYFDIIEWD